MKSKSPLILITFLYVFNCRIINAENNLKIVQEAFIKNEIVPDVIDTTPGELITVKYNGSEIVNLGNEIKPTQLYFQPIVNWKADSKNFYTLSMIDPDTRGRKEHLLREFSHWLVGNIPGDDIEKGDLLAFYIPSGPPKGTGLHRYIFLVYEQPEKLTFEEPRLTDISTVQYRVDFGIRKFAEKYNLGQPIAGNFFQAGWDSFVDSLGEKLGLTKPVKL